MWISGVILYFYLYNVISTATDNINSSEKTCERKQIQKASSLFILSKQDMGQKVIPAFGSWVSRALYRFFLHPEKKAQDDQNHSSTGVDVRAGMGIPYCDRVKD